MKQTHCPPAGTLRVENFRITIVLIKISHIIKAVLQFSIFCLLYTCFLNNCDKVLFTSMNKHSEGMRDKEQKVSQTCIQLGTACNPSNLTQNKSVTTNLMSWKSKDHQCQGLFLFPQCTTHHDLCHPLFPWPVLHLTAQLQLASPPRSASINLLLNIHEAIPATSCQFLLFASNFPASPGWAAVAAGCHINHCARHGVHPDPPSAASCPCWLQ